MSLLDWLCFYLFNLVHVFNQVQSHLLCLQILNSSFLVEILFWVKGNKTIVYFLKTKAMICLQLSVSLVQSCQTCQSFPLSLYYQIKTIKKFLSDFTILIFLFYLECYALVLYLALNSTPFTPRTWWNKRKPTISKKRKTARGNCWPLKKLLIIE